jgi:hypothetical protein
MTSEEWNRLFDLFHAAREKSGHERVMVLDAACGESTLLRRAVEELLREDEAADGFLSEPLFGSLRGEPRPSPISASADMSPWHLLGAAAWARSGRLRTPTSTDW